VKAGKLLVLVLVLSFGAAIETAWSLREKFGLGPLGWHVLGGRFRGPSFTFEDEETHELKGGGTVEVDNAFGAVTMVPGSAGEVKVKLRKVVYLSPESEARQFASGIHLYASPVGGGLRLSTNREEAGRDRYVGFETHLEIALPAGTPVKVRNEHGRVEVHDVGRAELSNSFEPIEVKGVDGDAVLQGRHGNLSVSGVRGALTVTARHGNLELQDVDGRSEVQLEHGNLKASRTGPLLVTLSHGDVEARTVRGDLEVRGEHAGVDAEEVSGRAQVATSFRDVRLAKVDGATRVKAKHGKVQASDVKGETVVTSEFDGVTLARIAGPVDVTVTHGGLQAEDLAAGARVKSSGDEVILDRFSGAIDVDAQRGGVDLRPAGALTQPMEVKAVHGGIRLAVPDGSRFQFEAAARHGELDVNVPGLAVMLSERSRVTGSMGGGGNLVRLTTEHGDVNVSAGASVAAKTP
jgi:DUF4097 and DUF4098 domain-containing protein YvlB